MERNLLLVLSLVSVFYFGSLEMYAEDVDLTHLIVNNDFEYVADGVPHIWDTWRPKDVDNNQGYTEFYGWECDLNVLTGISQGINTDMANHHGTYGCWIASSTSFPEFWEFSQTIRGLEAGIYKVQCLMSATKKVTSQRLFANQNVQYCKSEVDYEHNQTIGEIATFAGYSDPEHDKDLSEMVVYTAIEAGDSLKIGVRTGGIKGDGTKAANSNPAWGRFKVDYFRLTKIDDELSTGISDQESKFGYFVNNGRLIVKGVDSYVVYNINGVKVSEINNTNNMSVNLKQGIYIVRTCESNTFKVVVK